MECDVCKQNKTAVYKCDICRSRSCKVCGQLTASEVKVLELNSRVMKFYCVKCREHEPETWWQKLIECKDELISTKDKVIASKDRHIISMEEQILLLKKKIEDMNSECIETMQMNKRSYSEVLRKKSNEVVVIKPKKIQDSSITKSAIESKIDPGSITAGVSRVKYIKEGGVAISCGCEKKEDLITVSANIKRQLGEDYEVNIVEKKFPKIKIVNVDEKVIDNDFLEKLILQNGLKTEDSERKITLITHYKGNQGKKNVVIEVDPVTYSLINKKDRLSIGWRSYKFFDHINIIQCYKCYKYGHMAKECKSDKVVCSKCSSNHVSKDCHSEQKICVNCKYAADVLKVPNVDYNHEAYNRNCEVYKRIYKDLEEKINYPNVYSGKK